MLKYKSYLSISMTQNVDHDIEQFWLGFKTSMKKFYKVDINRLIDSWSTNLNALQSLKQYE